MTLTSVDIRSKQFGVTRFRPGYIDAEVDQFLDALEGQLDRLILENEELRTELATVVRGGIPRIPAPRAGAHGTDEITAADVRNKHFGLTRLHPGYVDEEVDEFLIEVEAELERLTRENSELRARLTEFSRGWERNAAFVEYSEYEQPSAPAQSMTQAPVGSPVLSQVQPRRQAPGGTMRQPSYQAVQGAPRSRRQWLEADVPATVPLYAEVGLQVRICSDPSDGSRGSQVTLIAQTRFELSPTAPLRQAVTLPESGNSDPVSFTFHAAQAGHYSIRVSAFAGGTFLGDLTAELSVEQGGRLTRSPVRVAELSEAQAVPGEVTLQVRTDGSQYIFQILSELYPFEAVVAGELAARPAEVAHRVTEALRAGHTGRNARSVLAQAGVGLWQDMVPDLIKDQFWQVRGNISALSIVCEQDILPWELLYPAARGADAGFLAEQFPVLRRITGQRPVRQISIGPPLYVVPAGYAGYGSAQGGYGRLPGNSGSSGNSEQEIAALRRRLGSGAGDVADMDQLLDLTDAGEFGLLHFACHEAFHPDASGSSITFAGGRLIPAFLSRAVDTRSLAQRSPLVFVNSSRDSETLPEYTRLTGWAEQFTAAGAGAFAGAAWAVRSASATVFAEAFYETLQEGRPLGFAATAARKAVAKESADPAWLAYSVYGDPAATVGR